LRGPECESGFNGASASLEPAFSQGFSQLENVFVQKFRESTDRDLAHQIGVQSELDIPFGHFRRQTQLLYAHIGPKHLASAISQLEKSFITFKEKELSRYSGITPEFDWRPQGIRTPVIAVKAA